MKVLIAALAHETQCFIPEITGADRFRTLRGDEILGCVGDGSTIDGFLEVARRQGWTVIPTAAASAMSSGRVADAVFEAFWREVEAVAQPAIAEGIDAIYLVLHGAMVTETIEDPEGELIKRLRALPGAWLCEFSASSIYMERSPPAWPNSPTVSSRIARTRIPTRAMPRYWPPNCWPVRWRPGRCRACIA
jgi:hypothetical protein